MNRIGSGLVCLVGLAWAALGGLGSTPAAAELVQTTQYRTHSVHGTTPRAVLDDMSAHPIIDPDDGPAYANLTHAHTVTLKTATTGGACRITDLTFRWSFVLTLPQAADYARMSTGTRSMWNAFVADLKRHEETHRSIFLGCGAKFVPAAEKLTGPAGCIGMKARVDRFIAQRYEACMAEQRAFELRDRSHILGLAFIKAGRGQ